MNNGNNVAIAPVRMYRIVVFYARLGGKIHTKPPHVNKKVLQIIVIQAYASFFDYNLVCFPLGAVFNLQKICTIG